MQQQHLRVLQTAAVINTLHLPPIVRITHLSELPRSNSPQVIIIIMIIIMIILLIIIMTMFMVLTSWLKVISRVHAVHAMNAEQRQTAADLWVKPTDLSHWPASRRLRKYIHHRHLLLLSPKAQIHFTIPQRVEGWVDLDGRLYTLTVYLRASTHPSNAYSYTVMVTVAVMTWCIPIHD